jgi:stress response protein SCP2
MELKITNPSSRVLLERSDNGLIVYEIGEENIVTSKIVYEMYFKDGILDFESIANFVADTMEILKVPLEEVETNRKMIVAVAKIDPEKPALGEEKEEE